MYPLSDSVYKSPLINMNNIILFDYVVQKQSIIAFIQSCYTSIIEVFKAFGTILKAFGTRFHELEVAFNKSISLIFNHLLKTDMNYILNILACIGALYLLMIPIVYIINYCIYLIIKRINERNKLHSDIQFLKSLYIETNILNDNQYNNLSSEVESMKYKLDSFMKNTNREMKKIARELHQFD